MRIVMDRQQWTQIWTRTTLLLFSYIPWGRSCVVSYCVKFVAPWKLESKHCQISVMKFGHFKVTTESHPRTDPTLAKNFVVALYESNIPQPQQLGPLRIPLKLTGILISGSSWIQSDLAIVELAGWMTGVTPGNLCLTRQWYRSILWADIEYR